MTTWAALGLKNSGSPLMQQLLFFHDNSLMILVMTTTLEVYLMFMLFFNSYKNWNLLYGQAIEVIWTILPAIILPFIKFPSLWL